ncbi:MAG: hypothetical protein ACKPKO_12450, partial [Candidatus Fonsibacter sp.]
EWYEETRPTYNAAADETPTQWNDRISTEEQFFKNKQTSEWVIQNVQAKCDLVTLDSGFENKIHNLLANGGYLPIN